MPLERPGEPDIGELARMPVRLVTAAVIAQDHQRLLPGVKRLDEALLGRLGGIDVDADIMAHQQATHFQAQLPFGGDRFPAVFS